MSKFFVFLAVTCVAFFPESASAADVFESSTNKMVELFKSLKQIVFVIGGFGLSGLSVGAIFGAVKWKWFASLAVGLSIVAAAGGIIDYSFCKGTNASCGVSYSSKLGDSFTAGRAGISSGGGGASHSDLRATYKF